MACFIVPATEAVVTTVIKKVVRSKEDKNLEHKDNGNVSDEEHMSAGESHAAGEIRFSEKLGWLNGMLWGGSGLLAFEHLWHGEIVPYFPFLTNAVNAADRAEMLSEMATSGVGMAVLVTLVWAGMVHVSNKIEKEGVSGSQTEHSEEAVR